MNKKILLIVYESNSPTLLDAINQVAASKLSLYSIVKKNIDEVVISDILGADAFMFALETYEKEKWVEFLRLCHGITFAGRKAAIFTSNTNSIDSSLREALKPTEIKLVKENFIIGKSDMKNAFSWL